MDEELTDVARRLGKRGGAQTKKRGREYFVRIGRLGAQKRWRRGPGVRRAPAR